MHKPRPKGHRPNELMGFRVRTADGYEYLPYADTAAAAAFQIANTTGKEVVFVLRGDEPLIRNRSLLRRLLDRWERTA